MSLLQGVDVFARSGVFEGMELGRDERFAA
jgi:hypothetical protein